MTDKEYLNAARYTVAVLRTMAEGTPLPTKPEDLPWLHVYTVANAHSLASTVFKYLEADIKREADPRLVAEWEKMRQIEFAKNIKQTAEFSRLTAALSEARIRFLPLKGFIMKRLYPSPELRTMADMDLLVDEENIPRVHDLLVGMGYTAEPELGEWVHVSFDKPPFLHVEIHRRLFFDSPYTIDDAIEKEGAPSWYLMSDLDLFAFLIRHAKKHYEGGGCGIRAVLDHYLFKKAHPELVSSPELTARLAEDGSSDFARIMDMLSDMWFGGKEPDEDIYDFELYTATGGTYGTVSNFMYRGMEKRGRGKQILSRIFPPPSIISARYRWVKKVPILMPVGYIWRIISSVFDGTVSGYMRAIKEADTRREERDAEKSENSNKKGENDNGN